MRILITLILGLSLSLSLIGQGLLQSEDARFRAQVEKDVAALDELVADELIYIHSNALVESKSDFLASVQSGKIVYAAMAAEDGRSVRPYGRKTAVVNGVVKVSGQYQGGQFDIRLRYTALYRKIKKVWQLTRWQSTRIPDDS